ncbi:zinc-binding alcohol dehydrogenase family protein [Cohnella panacarvi]|uniref:zinc-binding alcohol dehydrogenase family protein n=1 Tax=Cohnella panacarvi TaxID=400776 RepID=UPI00047C015C|nr:zinc-binding alcohol dehydrogenase family protein [Cohnella panacarvi]
MYAIGVAKNNRFTKFELETPTPEGKDLLVRVKAVSVNPVDLKARAGGNPNDEPMILGWDVAGVVEEVGEKCVLFKPGDEVFYAGSRIRPGCNSELHLVDERIVGKKPKSLDFAEAAALPLTAITAWEALFHRMKLSRHESDNEGRSILIIGAAGGVGSIATQLAKLAGLTVIGTASRKESSDWAREHGADIVINHRESFVPQLKAAGLDAADYILCLNSTAAHWTQMADAIAPQGKICAIVPAEKPVDVNAIFNKSIEFYWELMFTRPMFHAPDAVEQHRLLDAVSELVDAGRIRTTLTKRLSPINAANLELAHDTLSAGDMIGKLVLERFE